MLKLKENINATINYLNGHFEDNKGNVDLEYLTEAIYHTVVNNGKTEYLYKRLIESRRSPIHSIIWDGFKELVDMEIKHDGYKCSSYHLKKWLSMHGMDYKTCFKSLCDKLTEEREEYLQENN